MSGRKNMFVITAMIELMIEIVAKADYRSKTERELDERRYR